MPLRLPSAACTFSRDLQLRLLSDSYAVDRLPLALRAIAVAPASAARPTEVLLSYPSPPSRRDPPLVDAKLECGPSTEAFCRGLSTCLPRCVSQVPQVLLRSWSQSDSGWPSLSPSVRPCGTRYRSLRRPESGSA